MATTNTTRKAKKSPATPKKTAPAAPRKARKPRVAQEHDVPVERDGYLEGITARLKEDRDPEPPKRKAEPKVKIREGLEEEVLALLKDKLRIEISSGGFTDPNNRKVEVFFGRTKLSEANFDVVQTREYEG